MRPTLRIVARDGKTAAPPVHVFAFGVGPSGYAAMIDGQVVPIDDAFAAMKAHSEMCADYARLQFETLIAQRLYDNEMASTPGGIR